MIPGAFRLPQTPRQKPDLTRRETAFPEQPTHLRETVPPPVPPSEAPPFEFHEALSAELQQPSIIEPSVEASAAPKAFGVAKRADFKMSIDRLLGSESSFSFVRF
jgi:hypothetical protein